MQEISNLVNNNSIKRGKLKASSMTTKKSQQNSGTGT